MEIENLNGCFVRHSLVSVCQISFWFNYINVRIAFVYCNPLNIDVSLITGQTDTCV